MIAKFLSSPWTAVAPSLGNHLWQSTLFACVIALLMLALRNNRAQIRYCLWLAASLKFLVPFSLLVGIGSTPNKSATQDASMNVTPASGRLSGTNVRLIAYLYFAYQLTGNQLQLLMPQLPKWVISDHFDIQAHADGNPSKDQMRLMMQSLLADRFKLASHYETRRLPVFDLVLAKPGTTGPQLQPHPEDSTCSTALSQTSAGAASAPMATVAGGLPTVCGAIEGMPPSPSGRLRAGARGAPIGLLASTLAQIGNLDRAVLDRTGLSGNFDFTFEWTPQLHGPGTPQEVLPVAANAHSGQAGPTFQQDLQEQLGLKLEPQDGPVEVLVIDHIERPSQD